MGDENKEMRENTAGMRDGTTTAGIKPPAPAGRCGKVYAVGIGPGSPDHLTPAARAALDQADVLCGYPVYTALIRPLYPGKDWYETPMGGEIRRCRYALEAARSGKTAAVVCGGDAGVYGLAGALMELGEEYPEVEIEVVPGITAALAGAAVLGAPLSHDFCVVSLSDLLTPWEVIEHRLRMAAAGDFVLCLYNPASRGRRDHLRRACDILLETLPPETVCGWVRNIARSGEESRMLSLAELRETEADMFTTVFIGSRATKSLSGRMVTPRGYREVREKDPLGEEKPDKTPPTAPVLREGARPS